MASDRKQLKLEEKHLETENNMKPDSIDSDENQRKHSFEVDPIKKNNDDMGEKKVFKPSQKKRMQLSFDSISIRAIAKQRKCCRKNQEPPAEKAILDNVSGTILPG